MSKKMVMMGNQSLLPEGFLECKYLESPSVAGYGKCLIETGLTYLNKIVHITLQGDSSQKNAYTVPVGGYQDFATVNLAAYKNSNGYALSAAKYSGIPITEKVNVVLKITPNPDDEYGPQGAITAVSEATINGISVKSVSGTKLVDNKLYLFSSGSSQGSSVWNFVGKIFKCTITDLEGNILARYKAAVRESDNTPGFYDTIRHRFDVNTGSGNLNFKLK